MQRNTWWDTSWARSHVVKWVDKKIEHDKQLIIIFCFLRDIAYSSKLVWTHYQKTKNKNTSHYIARQQQRKWATLQQKPYKAFWMASKICTICYKSNSHQNTHHTQVMAMTTAMAIAIDARDDIDVPTVVGRDSLVSNILTPDTNNTRTYTHGGKPTGSVFVKR